MLQQIRLTITGQPFVYKDVHIKTEADKVLAYKGAASEAIGHLGLQADYDEQKTVKVTIHEGRIVKGSKIAWESYDTIEVTLPQGDMDGDLYHRRVEEMILEDGGSHSLVSYVYNKIIEHWGGERYSTQWNAAKSLWKELHAAIAGHQESGCVIHKTSKVV